MTTFLLIRHGDNDSLGHKLVGWTPGIHLNARGRAQSERLAERLSRAGVRAIYSSPLERARETAEPLARRLGIEVRVLEEIGEIRLGEWTGRTFEELRQDPRWRQVNAFRSGARIPGGETMLEVEQRMAAALEQMRAAHPGEVVVVVTHGDPIRAILCHYLGMPLDLMHRLEIAPASVSVLRLGDDWAQAPRINVTDELP
jgi:probable phosphomutase (TIGR03848 family)